MQLGMCLYEGALSIFQVHLTSLGLYPQLGLCLYNHNMIHVSEQATPLKSERFQEITI